MAVHSSQLWTKAGISDELRIDRKRVSKVLATIPPDRKVKSRYDGWYLVSVIPALYGFDDSEDEGQVVTDPDLLLPKDRKDWLDGTKTKIAILKEVGELMETSEHRRVLAEFALSAVQEIEVLPDFLERDCGATPEMIMKAQDCVDKVRVLAYERVTSSE
jgi:hypothetical protein